MNVPYLLNQLRDFSLSFHFCNLSQEPCVIFLSIASQFHTGPSTLCSLPLRVRVCKLYFTCSPAASGYALPRGDTSKRSEGGRKKKASCFFLGHQRQPWHWLAVAIVAGGHIVIPDASHLGGWRQHLLSSSSSAAMGSGAGSSPAKLAAS